MKHKNWNFIFKDKIYENYINLLFEKKFKILKSLKDDKRSLVQLIEMNNKKYVYKVPREKNKRVWQRIINIFRSSDSIRNYKTMNKLEQLNIKSTKAVLAAEKRNPFVVDSFLLMEYLEAEDIKKSDYSKVIEELESIHKKGYLHGDSQIQNFLKKDNEIYVIDLRLQKNIYGEFGKKYEFIYLKESCKEIEKLYGNMVSKFSYKVALLYKKWLYLHGDIRKIIKRKK